MIFQLRKFEVNLCSPNCKTVIILVQVYSISKPVQALVKENSNLIKLRSFRHFEILFMTIRISELFNDVISGGSRSFTPSHIPYVFCDSRV